MLFKCRFVAWKMGLPRKLANCVFILINIYIFFLLLFMRSDPFYSLSLICTGLGSFLYSAAAPLLAVASIVDLHGSPWWCFWVISWFTSPHLTLCVWSWLFPQVLTCTGHGTFLGDRRNNCDLKNMHALFGTCWDGDWARGKIVQWEESFCGFVDC